ncbi:hypothetical protein ETAA8_55550 [Anatilimnocola aggregata]|uniref:DUF1207 domain-containing protein n=1 Tax=Anatilimnocola aggregata TaxID=2528021 RepID=A0A517YJM0_9BACT|nr:DUF1207 domain-containing protein [Anatilimnocola aggregata]QDU30415.1 hypothetical protein ETAA8_55550 [Anatilimnocola aggregata]
MLLPLSKSRPNSDRLQLAPCGLVLSLLLLATVPAVGQDGSIVNQSLLFSNASLLQPPMGTNQFGPDELPLTTVTEQPPVTESPTQQYFDMDQYLDSHPHISAPCEPWSWHLLPDGLIYKSYLAGAKESRLSAHIIHETDHYALWDATLGGRVGIWRYGNSSRINPEGFQVDVEGSAQVRLDIQNNVDVQAVDFRGGMPLTYGIGQHRFKFAYYHLSSHLGDEFLIENPTYPRLNFARDVFVLGHSFYWTEKLRLYSEVGWAFYTDVSEPWEFQFGIDWAPTRPTGWAGEPFFAINGHLREELNFGGNLTVQTGWAWVGDENSHLLRAGLHYFNGGSSQFSFYQEHEQQLGFGLWYDY